MMLKGKLVVLRPLCVEDAALTLGWRASQRARFLNKGAQNIEEQKAWIHSSECAGDLNFMIEYLGVAVGMISLYNINHTHHSAIMGRLLIGEEKIVAKNPVAFEAEMLILDYAFEQLSIHSIYGDVMSGNIGVNQMRKYLRWHQDGVMREHYFSEGKYQDAVLYSLLKDEYYLKCRPRLNGILAAFLGVSFALNE